LAASIMTDTCGICYEGMTIPGYIATDHIEVQGDYTRLECGHAMHTKCMIESLQAYKGKCALCNRETFVEHDTYEDRMIFEGKCTQVLNRVKKNPAVLEAIADYNAFNTEFKAKLKHFDQRLVEMKEQLREETDILRYLDDRDMMANNLRKVFRAETKKAGSLYFGALNHLCKWRQDRIIFGRTTHSRRWNDSTSYIRRHLIGTR
jgi:hypothetical protein